MASEAVKIPFIEAAAPSTPASGRAVIYAKADGLMYSKDDAGVETLMSSGAAGAGMATDPLWDAAGDLAQGTGANAGAKLTIGSTNRLLKVVAGSAAWGLPHAFGCIISGTSTALGTGAYTSLSFGTADTYDPDAYHDPSGSPTLITIPTGLTGYYGLSIRAEWPSGSSNDRRLAYRINGGTDFLMDRWNWSITTVTNIHTSTIFVPALLSATDTIECRMFTNLGSTTTTVYQAVLMLQGVA